MYVFVYIQLQSHSYSFLKKKKLIKISNYAILHTKYFMIFFTSSDITSPENSPEDDEKEQEIDGGYSRDQPVANKKEVLVSRKNEQTDKQAELPLQTRTRTISSASPTSLTISNSRSIAQAIEKSIHNTNNQSLTATKTIPKSATKTASKTVSKSNMKVTRSFTVFEDPKEQTEVEEKEEEKAKKQEQEQGEQNVTARKSRRKSATSALSNITNTPAIRTADKPTASIGKKDGKKKDEKKKDMKEKEEYEDEDANENDPTMSEVSVFTHTAGRRRSYKKNETPFLLNTLPEQSESATGATKTKEKEQVKSKEKEQNKAGEREEAKEREKDREQMVSILYYGFLLSISI